VAHSVSLIVPIPSDKQEKRGWTVKLDGETIRNVGSLQISNPNFGVVTYGLTPPGYDGWSFKEIGGGGSVIVPYAQIDKQLYIGVVEQARHNQGGKVLNVPRGFLDPGESHFQAANREVVEETGYDPGDKKTVELVGDPMNPNSAFFETPEKNEGVKCYALQIQSRELEEREGMYVFRSGILRSNASSKSARLAEQILGTRFIPYQQAVRLGDMFTVAAVGRLIGQLDIVTSL
jgi:8-oxo-dGTP pyrophosphatase MutT (NUDIX family)